MWRDLLSSTEFLNLPYKTGRCELFFGTRSWKIEGYPNVSGWYRWEFKGRKAWCKEGVLPDYSVLTDIREGYLVGEHFIPDHTYVDPLLKNIMRFDRVVLLENDLDRFSRIRVGTTGGPDIFYAGPAFPLGPESDVALAYQDRADSVSTIPGIPPALDAAFRSATHLRDVTEKRRLEEAERAEREARFRRLREQAGTAEGRRLLSSENFEEAARSALAFGGATYLDSRPSTNPGESVVQYRLRGQRFECVCNRATLGIIEAGICLTDEDTGIRYDQQYSLETLPSVVSQAIDLGVLVVFRHVR